MNGDWVRGVRNEQQIGADIAARCHTHTYSPHTVTPKCAHIQMLTHTHSPLVLLSDTQMVRAVDELSVSLSVLVTAEINDPTGQKRGKDQISWMEVVRVCAPE